MEKNYSSTTLTIYTDEKYENMKVGENYSTSFKMIGNTIFYMKTVGDMATSDLGLIIDKRNEFLDTFFSQQGLEPKKQRVIEIRDLSETSGRPDHHNKNVQTEFLLSNENRIIAYILIGIPKVSEIIYKVGLTFFGSPFPIKIVKNYNEAMEMAAAYAGRNHQSKHDGQNTDRKWQFKGEKLEIDVSIRNDNILLFTGKGFLSASSLPGIKKLILQVFQEGDFDKNNYYRVLDYSKIEGSTLKGRIEYLKIWNEIFRKYNAVPVRSYVCGAKSKVATTIKLLNKFTEMKLLYVDSVDIAMNKIQKKSDLEETDNGEIVIHRKDIDLLISLIGSIGWEIGDFDLSEEAFEINKFNNPLDEVVDAVKVLSGDFASLISNEKKIKSELEEQNMMLRKTREEALEANMAKSRFLNTMSHELRTPMNGMVGFIDLLLDTKLGAEQKEYMDYLKKSTFSLLEKITDILEYTDLENNDLSYTGEFIFIRDYLAQLQDKTQKQMIKELGVLLEVDKNVPDFLFIDEKFLSKVFDILINNAIKFTEEGYVKIFANLIDSGTDENNVLVQFGIEDTGIGIPENKQNTIFDIFTQVDSKISRNYEGSGLGLSIFKKMISCIKGNVYLSSQEGKGSIFSFSLNLKYK